MVAVARYDYPRELARRWNWRWFLTPATLLIAMLIPHKPITSISFKYSRASLENYATQIMQNPNAPWPPRRAGVLLVEVTEASPTLVRFFCGYGYDGARCGYVYSPTTAPADADQGSLRHDHIDGPWYEYWDHTWPIAARPATAPIFPATQPTTQQISP